MTDSSPSCAGRPWPATARWPRCCNWLRPAEDSRPRASDTLAAFIAERGSGATPGASCGCRPGNPACWWFSAAPRTPSRLAAWGS